MSKTDPTSLAWGLGVVHLIDIHTAKLPTKNVSLDYALTHIDHDTNTISPWMNPVEWIRTDSNYVHDIVDRFGMLVKSDEIEFPKVMIYSRLVAYVLAHLMQCTSDTRILSGFKETLRHWNAWDIITMIENHQLIKDHVTNLFQEHLQVHESHSESIYRELLSLDVIGLCTHLTVTVIEDDKYREVLTRRGTGAQSLLDLLQARLDFSMNPAHKSRHVKALMKLSKASGLYPECLVLKGVDMEKDPVTRGSYGDVHMGLLQGKQIAVKVLRLYLDTDLAKFHKEFSSEAVLWRQLSHPNVLPFYGVYHLEEQRRRLCLTSPWMENGNVIDFLRKHPDTNCVHLALDISQGLEYLHSLSPSIVHGDLKGANVLVTHSRRVCIADFGLATVKDSKTLVMSTAKSKGTVRWQAPELLDPDECYHSSKASDIYAFACVCYEMFSDDIPFCEVDNEYRVALKVTQGNRPTRPSHDISMTRGLSDAVWELVETCWNPDPTKRHTAKHIIERFHALPGLPTDERPVDDFNIMFPSQMLYNHAEHPFYALPSEVQNPLSPHHRSFSSAGSRPSTSSCNKDGHGKPNEAAKWHSPLSKRKLSEFEGAEDEDNDSTRPRKMPWLDKGNAVDRARTGPPTPTFSISPSDDNSRPGLLDPYHSGLTPRIQELSPNSAVQPSRGPIYANDIMLPLYNMTPSAPSSIDSPNWQSQTSYAPSEFPSRALMSSFSPTCTQDYVMDDFDALINNSLVINNPLELEEIPSNGVVAVSSIPDYSYELAHHYLCNVVETQYPFADRSKVDKLMLETLQSSSSALDAACLLASQHRHALRHGAPVSDPESQNHFSRVRQSIIGKPHLSEGDAMAGLHVVSWALFGGGRGQWPEFLHVACRYSDGVLWHPQYRGPQDALMQCSEATRFIIKTSMWYDVMGSATRVEIPYFLEVFRGLFDPNSAYIDDSPSSSPEQLSMLPTMGCENRIVWALAEISNLACWKELQKGVLSMPELVKRGTKIEKHLMPPASPPVCYDELEHIRILTSQVFRASARVYLHSVLSGDYPSCKEITEGVADTIYWLKQVPEQGARSVARSVVFSICICGCLTDDPSQRDFFLRWFEKWQVESVGNCASIKELIQQVWRSRENWTYDPVTWRDVMRKSQILV